MMSYSARQEESYNIDENRRQPVMILISFRLAKTIRLVKQLVADKI